MISFETLKFNSYNSLYYGNAKNVFQAFKGSGEDIFVSNRSIDTTMDNKYTQVNPSIDMEKIKKAYQEKISVLPLIMDRVMASVGNYISGRDDADVFVERFLDGSSSLATRIDIDHNNDEYCENYKPELDMIKNASPVCNDFSRNKVSKKELDSRIEECVCDYVDDNTKRTKNFIN